MGSLHNMIICPQQKFLYRYFFSFHIYVRHFSTKKCSMRNKVGAVKYKSCQTELNIQGCPRFTNMCFSHSEIKPISFRSNMVGRHPCGLLAESHGYKTLNINASFPTSYMKMGSQCFFSGNRSWKFQNNIEGLDSNDEYEGELEDSEEENYDEMVRRVLHLSDMGHEVLVVQPYGKWGSAMKLNTTPELQLAEAVALIRSIPKWRVVDKVTIALSSLNKKQFLGGEHKDMLKQKIRKDTRITAIFINAEIFLGFQFRELETVFRVPVYDRYMVAVMIFREHAASKEAKLRIAMAEIPYLWRRLKGSAEGAPDHRGGGLATIGGSGDSRVEVRKRILKTRKIKLKRILEKLHSQRSLSRNRRQKLEYPVITVVGYTNAGKTSLIKALTGESSLEPKNHPFATAHGGILPSGLKVLYVDTVGFISDLPVNLIGSFVVTLEDALLADVIIHVRDISHPDYKAQAETVTNTLKILNPSSNLLDNMLVVGNKIDLKEPPIQDLGCNLLVSAVTNQGLDDLIVQIDKAILKATGRFSIVIRVPMDGEELRWLYKNSAVTEVTADSKDSRYLLMKVVISETQLSKFRHNFKEVNMCGEVISSCA